MGGYEKLRPDGTGHNLNPQEMSFREASDEARYKQVIAAWDIKKDYELQAKQRYPGLGDKDLLPSIGLQYSPDVPQKPGRWTPPPQPHNFFAIGKREDGLPLDVIEYSTDKQGHLTYKQQYLFQYDQLADGKNRVTVQNWVPSDRSTETGPKRTIGNQVNTLVGVTQYYRNGSDTVRAEYWTAASVVEPITKSNPERHPDLRVDFRPDATNVIISKKGASGLFGGGIRESGSEAKFDLIPLLKKCNFYDLFGPPL